MQSIIAKEIMAEDFIIQKTRLAELEKRASELLLRDRPAAVPSINRIRQRINAGQPVDRMLDNLENSIINCERFVLKTAAGRMNLHLPLALSRAKLRNRIRGRWSQIAQSRSHSPRTA